MTSEMWRCQPCQERVSVWSRPSSFWRSRSWTPALTPELSRVGLAVACLGLVVGFTASDGDGWRFPVKAGVFGQTHPPAARRSWNQAIYVVGEIGERQFGFGAGEPDGPDEEAEAVFFDGRRRVQSGRGWRTSSHWPVRSPAASACPPVCGDGCSWRAFSRRAISRCSASDRRCRPTPRLKCFGC